MARSYRDVETAQIPTDPAIGAAAEAALSILRRQGGDGTATGEAGTRLWRHEQRGPAGTRLDLSCIGPTLPSRIPPFVVNPADIARERPFIVTWRLTIRAPILVLDLAWQADKQLRIMTFANGDWQRELTAADVSPAR